jgi:ribosomal protein S18 acetylase RimI-like enzyme
MEPCSSRSARQSELQILRSELAAGAWSDLARLLESACTKPEWFFLRFEAGVLADMLVLAAPGEFNLPLEIIRLHGGQDTRNDGFRVFRRAIEKAKALGSAELYCTVPEDSSDMFLLPEAGFFRWRKVVRFESAGPGDVGVRGYRSAEVGKFSRSEIVKLIERTSEGCSDSQIEFYRQRLGGMADAEMTLRMLESTKYDPRWWRVALSPERHTVGVVFPVIAFGEPTIGFIGIIPEYRGRSVASFLLTEAWSAMKQHGHSTLCAEADERSVSMHRAFMKSQFSPRSRKQEWRLDLSGFKSCVQS